MRELANGAGQQLGISKALLPGDALVVDCLLQRERGARLEYECYGHDWMTLGRLQQHGVVLSIGGAEFVPNIAPVVLWWLVDQCEQSWCPTLWKALRTMLERIVTTKTSAGVDSQLDWLVMQALFVRALALTYRGDWDSLSQEAKDAGIVTTLANVIRCRPSKPQCFGSGAKELLERHVSLRNVSHGTAHVKGEDSMWEAMEAGAGGATFVVAGSNINAGFRGLVSLPCADAYTEEESGERVTVLIEVVKHRTVEDATTAVSIAVSLEEKVQEVKEQLTLRGKQAMCEARCKAFAAAMSHSLVVLGCGCRVWVCAMPRQGNRELPPGTGREPA